MFNFKSQQQKIDEYLDDLYNTIWNGTEEDKYYSWFRLVSHMRCWNYDPRYISRAMARMNKCKENRSQSYLVNSGGKLVQVTEIS